MTHSLEYINANIPQNYLWDGFWVDSFTNGTLDISASFDRIYYRDIAVNFTGVTFFNVPHWWRDNAVVDMHNMFVHANVQEFTNTFPETDVTNKMVVAVKLNLPRYPQVENLYTFYIVCDTAELITFNNDDNGFNYDYKDPLINAEIFPSLKNRVPFLVP